MPPTEGTSREHTSKIVEGTHQAVDSIDDFVDDERLSQIMDMQRSVLKKFAGIKEQLESLDKETVQQVDDACKEITRNRELLAILKADLDGIYTKVRSMKRKLAVRLQQESIQ